MTLEAVRDCRFTSATQNGVPQDANRRDTVLGGLLSTAAAQTGPCGFTNGVSDEPLLDLDGC